MKYALVVDGVVTNIIILSPLNAKNFPNAINIDGISVQIGDTYEDGRFYRNGEPLYSPEEQLQDAVTALQTLGYAEVNEDAV